MYLYLSTSTSFPELSQITMLYCFQLHTPALFTFHPFPSMVLLYSLILHQLSNEPTASHTKACSTTRWPTSSSRRNPGSLSKASSAASFSSLQSLPLLGEATAPPPSLKTTINEEKQIGLHISGSHILASASLSHEHLQRDIATRPEDSRRGSSTAELPQCPITTLELTGLERWRKLCWCTGD
jgi:hypothetical protein